jgi:hypothetical protein
MEERHSMTIHLKPEQERVLLEAIRSGLAQSTDEALDQALDSLRVRLPNHGLSGTVFERGLGLFGSPEDSSLLDEVVSLAYEERRRPSPQLAR